EAWGCDADRIVSDVSRARPAPSHPWPAHRRECDGSGYGRVMTVALVEVATARDRFEGDLLVALLESEGIEALLFVDDAAQMYGSLGQIEPVTIRVRAEDA